MGVEVWKYYLQSIWYKDKDLPFPVLTNSSYPTSAKAAASALRATGDSSINFNDNSLQRFSKACSMVQHYQDNKIGKPIVDYGFEILKNVSQKDFTKWSIVYDQKNKKIYFNTARYQQVKSVSYESFNFRCSAGSKALDMNQALTGDVYKHFINFDDIINRSLLEKAASESKEIIALSEKDKNDNVIYAREITCNDLVK